MLVSEVNTVDQRVAEMLRGHARANEFLERERMERLARLSPEESYAIFLDLMEHGHEMLSSDPLPEQMLPWRLESKIAVRETFRRLARKQGLTTNSE
jgi:formate dehydrogenase maturation protein FdhE